MKRLITTSFIAAAVALGVSSCNNGSYTANPKKDVTSAVNPFDPTVLHKTLLGTMQGNIDGKMTIFAGYYSIDPNNGNRIMYGHAISDSVFNKTITIVGSDAAFVGQRDANVSATLTYTLYDTVLKRNKIYQKDVPIAIFSDNGGKSLGTIYATMNRVEPPPADPQDSVVFDNMQFYLEKK